MVIFNATSIHLETNPTAWYNVLGHYTAPSEASAHKPTVIPKESWYNVLRHYTAPSGASANDAPEWGIRMKKLLILFLVPLLLLGTAQLSSRAFDGNDYGGDWSGDGGGGSDWHDDDDDDYYYGNSDDDGDNGNPLEALAILVLLAAFGLGMLIRKIFIKLFSKNKPSAGGVRSSSNQGRNILLPDRTAEVENIIKSHDPNFSASDLVTFVKQVYIDIETAWMNRDMKPVRPVLHVNLYNATVKQVQAKIDQGVVYHYESMVVNTAYITSYAKDAQFEYVTFYLNARRIDWQENEETHEILRGDKTTRWDMRYKMKFARSLGAVTKEEIAGVQGYHCPNCGASLEISSSGECPYCLSVVTTGRYNWVLTDYGTVRDDTVDEGIRIDSLES